MNQLHHLVVHRKAHLVQVKVKKVLQAVRVNHLVVRVLVYHRLVQVKAVHLRHYLVAVHCHLVVLIALAVRANHHRQVVCHHPVLQAQKVLVVPRQANHLGVPVRACRHPVRVVVNHLVALAVQSPVVVHRYQVPVL